MRACGRDLRQIGDDFPDLLEELHILGPEKPGNGQGPAWRGSNVPITLLARRFQRTTGWNVGIAVRIRRPFAPEFLYAAAQLYRDRFQPGDCKGRTAVACDRGRDVAAQRLFTTPLHRFLRLIRNQPAIVAAGDSMDPLWRDRAASVEANWCGRGIECQRVGGTGEAGKRTGADEVIVVTDTYEHADRLQSYKRVAEVAAAIPVKHPVAVEA
jgi:hypothetical protein